VLLYNPLFLTTILSTLVTLNNLGAHGSFHALNGLSLVHRYVLPAYKGELKHIDKTPVFACPPNHRVVVQEQRLGIKLSDCLQEKYLSKQN
jgi:hypothetical protein